MGSYNTPDQQQHHVLMVSFPGQGHINPLLRLANLLASKGLFITFSTTLNSGQRMLKSTTSNEPINIGEGQLCFEFFSDGYEENNNNNSKLKRSDDIEGLMNHIATVGRASFTQLIKNQSEMGRPVSCIINNPFVPWVTDVAADMGIPCAVLWVQSCAVFSAYYHYCHNLVLFPTDDQPKLCIQLPGLPVLEHDEIPSFLYPSSPHKYLKNAILAQFRNLSKCFCVLVDSFQELESLKLLPTSLLSPNIRPIGPLFKNPINMDGDQGGDRNDFLSSTKEDECLKWLDTQPPSSVVYVAFGSIVAIGKNQMEEMAKGLLSSGVGFLWVVRKPMAIEANQDLGILPDWFTKEAGQKGLVVHWAPQDRVLTHPSIACFLTHCGWNSSMESLSSGVPIIAFPQWGDQVTNAKMLVDECGVGVRLIHSENDLKTFSRENVERCILQVMRGPKAEDIKRNALKWKRAAEEAVAEGGSSNQNIQDFVDEVKQMSGKDHICDSVNINDIP